MLAGHTRPYWQYCTPDEKLLYMDCPRCSAPIRGNERNCPSCDSDVGYPNARAAKEYEEKAALAKRYAEALENASGRGCGDVVVAFLGALKSSVAAICRRSEEHTSELQ